MADTGQQGDDDGGGLASTVLLHHRGTGKYAALTQAHLDHLIGVTKDDALKDSLTALNQKAT